MLMVSGGFPGFSEYFVVYFAFVLQLSPLEAAFIIFFIIILSIINVVLHVMMLMYFR